VRERRGGETGDNKRVSCIAFLTFQILFMPVSPGVLCDPCRVGGVAIAITGPVPVCGTCQLSSSPFVSSRPWRGREHKNDCQSPTLRCMESHLSESDSYHI
jgi:hypothetical protein